MANVNYYLRFGSDSPANHSGLSPTFTSFRNQAGGATTAPAITEISTVGLYTFAYDPQGSINFIADGATTGLGSADRFVTGALDTIDKSAQLYAYGTTLTALGSTLVAIGTTNFALGTTAVALGITNVAIGTTLIGYGVTNLAIGTTLIGFGVTNVALGTTNVALGTTNVALGTTGIAYGIVNVGLGTTNVAIGTTILASLAFGPTLSFLIGNTTSLIGDNVTPPTTVFGFIMRTRQWLEGDSTYTKASGVLQNYDTTGATLLSQVTISDTGPSVTRT